MKLTYVAYERSSDMTLSTPKTRSFQKGSRVVSYSPPDRERLEKKAAAALSENYSQQTSLGKMSFDEFRATLFGK